MAYTHRELNLTHEPREGWAHFVLYTEPNLGVAKSALNAEVTLEEQTPYVREWLGRLQPCEPNALHATLVEPAKIPDLFHPCVTDDKNSPSAVAGSGCVCYQTFYDPEFGLPIVAHHYRTVGGNTDRWTHFTYAPLDLRPSDDFAYLIIDFRGTGDTDFWVRTADGLLSLLPQQEGHGYGVGYGGGGPGALARYLQKLIISNGQDTAAINRRSDDVDDRILSWVSSKNAAQSQELTLDDLGRI